MRTAQSCQTLGILSRGVAALGVPNRLGSSCVVVALASCLNRTSAEGVKLNSRWQHASGVVTFCCLLADPPDFFSGLSLIALRRDMSDGG